MIQMNQTYRVKNINETVLTLEMYFEAYGYYGKLNYMTK